MIAERKLSLFKGIKEIVFRYIETDYPMVDTPVTIYDTYKLNIMLSDGLAAILSDRAEIYNSFSGDVLFFAPEEIHHGRVLRQGIHKYIEILIPTEYFPNFKSYYFLFNDNSNKRTNILSPASNSRAVILSIAERMVNAINSTCNEISLFYDFAELLKLCTFLYENKEKCNTSLYIPATLQNAIDFIQREFSQNIQTTDIASASKCSTSYLSRIFKKHLGKSPYCYLTEYRLFMAEKYLRNGYSVTDAALMSGFSDSSVFIKRFKKSFGITPLKYKELYK